MIICTNLRVGCFRIQTQQTRPEASPTNSPPQSGSTSLAQSPSPRSLTQSPSPRSPSSNSNNQQSFSPPSAKDKDLDKNHEKEKEHERCRCDTLFDVNMSQLRSVDVEDKQVVLTVFEHTGDPSGPNYRVFDHKLLIDCNDVTQAHNAALLLTTYINNIQSLENN